MHIEEETLVESSVAYAPVSPGMRCGVLINKQYKGHGLGFALSSEFFQPDQTYTL